MKLAIRVTVSGLSGETNAYVSVPSATGSLEISGASRWDDISLASRGVEDAGHEVAVLDDHLALADEQPDLGKPVVLDVGDDRLAGAVLVGPGRRVGSL